MAGISTTDDLRELAEERLKEARVLLEAERYSGAYYLAGYAVEFALKAVLTKSLSSHSMPLKKDIVESHSHDLAALARRTGIEPEADDSVRRYWSQVAGNWTSESRYRKYAPSLAKDMVEAAERVFEWLKLLW